MLQCELTNRSDDRGDTLIELVMTLAIIGLTVAALLGALATTLASSGEHRSVANLDTILRSNADEAKYLIQLQSSPWFADGASITLTTYNGNDIPFAAPSGYTVTLSGIKYWNGLTNRFDSSYSNPADTTGFQLLTLSAMAPNGLTESLSIGVRAAT